MEFKRWLQINESSPTTRRKSTPFLPPHPSDYADRSGSAKDLMDFAKKMKKAKDMNWPMFNIDIDGILKIPVYSPESQVPPTSDEHKGQTILPQEPQDVGSDVAMKKIWPK